MPTNKPLRWTAIIFLSAVAFSVLTGFAQMPIFKRYYIADIPGLGWLAQFYVTHILHYLSAVAVIALGVFLAINYLLARHEVPRLSISGRLRAILLLSIVLSGAVLAFRNLPGYRLAPRMVMTLDFTHLGLVMFFLFTALAAKLGRLSWLQRPSRP
jgi:hypothetical protein